MDKLRELRAQLNRFRDNSSDERVRADCFNADLELESFENFLRLKLEHRDVRLRMARHHSLADHPVMHEPSVPQLFANNVPITQLFLRDFNYRLNKVKLREVLSAQGFEDVEIKSLKNTKSGSVAIVVCKSLASSCKIQVKSCKKELTFTNPKGKVSYIKIRPDQFSSQNPLLPTQSFSQKTPVLPQTLSSLLDCPQATNHLLKHVSANDIYNFYIASFENSKFLAVDFIFDSAADRYNNKNGLNLMLEDARKLNFRSILFNAHRITIETPFVNKLLNICANHRLDPDRRLWLQQVDLSAVAVSEQTIKTLSESCSILHLTLGNTPGGCERALDIDKLKTLTLVDNAQLSLEFLSKDCFSLITSLKIIGCNEVPMDKLFNFVAVNTNLKTLVFKDSQSRNKSSVDLLRAVFSSTNRIEEFQFEYSNIKEFRTHLIPNLVLNQATSLRALNLENNDFFKNWIPPIMDNAPNLTELNILGLEFDYSLPLHKLPFLVSLKLNYNQAIETTLASLVNKSKLDVVVNNARGKKRSRAINLASLRNVTLGCAKLNLRFINCKFAALASTQRALESDGATLRQSGSSIIICKR